MFHYGWGKIKHENTEKIKLSKLPTEFDFNRLIADSNDEMFMKHSVPECNIKKKQRRKN